MPYWDNYVLKNILNDVARYGTVHNKRKTMEKLIESVEKEGWNFTQSDFSFKKDSSHTVTITLEYEDVVKVFGQVLWEIDFQISETAERTNL